MKFPGLPFVFTLTNSQMLMKPFYAIRVPHRDVTVLYNGNGKHDKLYIVATLCYTDSPDVCDILGFYKARTATRWNVSFIEKEMLYQDSIFAHQRAVAKKTSKGYGIKLEDKELLSLGVDPLVVLSTSLGQIGSRLRMSGDSANDENSSVQAEAPANHEFECVDDFGVKGHFIIGCIYLGRTYQTDVSKLEMENDNGQTMIVDRELFKLVGD